MRPALLLDPGLIIPDASDNPRALAGFWLRFTEWASDDRSRLGNRAYEELSQFSGELHRSEYVPSPLRKTVHSTIGKILAKGPLAHGETACASVLTTAYLGRRDHARVLVDDLVGTAGEMPVILGTDPGFWAPSTVEVGCVPPPPGNVPLHFAPGLPTADERRAAMANWFCDQKIVVVGGQVDLHIKQNLADAIGVNLENFLWIPSEYNKKASNVSGVIKGLKKESAIVICITGKVGHATSKSVETACKKALIPYRHVEFASGLRTLLEGVFDSRAC